jgi:hypothetical protein
MNTSLWCLSGVQAQVTMQVQVGCVSGAISVCMGCCVGHMRLPIISRDYAIESLAESS